VDNTQNMLQQVEIKQRKNIEDKVDEILCDLHYHCTVFLITHSYYV